MLTDVLARMIRGEMRGQVAITHDENVESAPASEIGAAC